jgi:hypothetical protein
MKVEREVMEELDLPGQSLRSLITSRSLRLYFMSVIEDSPLSRVSREVERRIGFRGEVILWRVVEDDLSDGGEAHEG